MGVVHMSYIYFSVLLLAALYAFTLLKPAMVTGWALSVERKRSGLKLKSEAVHGFNIPFLEGGSGDVLVLVHGFGGDKDNFTRMAAHLTPHFRVILPDLPGFGDATRDPNVRYRMSDQVDRLYAFFRALGVQKIILGGNSMGGFIASEYAARHPKQVRAVWLLDSAGTAEAHRSPMLQNYLATGESPLLLRRLSDVETLIHSTMARPPFFPGFLKRTLGARAIADLPLHEAIMKDLSLHSPMLETQYKSLPTPALIVWGSEDAILNPAGQKPQEQLFPQNQTIVMQGIGHLPMLEAPQQTAQDFLKFAKTLPA